MKMLRRSIIVLLALALAAGLGGPVRAQGGYGMDQVRVELERTDDLIQRAGDLIRSSNNDIAGQALERATKLQEGAWNQFNGRQYGMAMVLTRKAREQAQSAVSAFRQNEQMEGVVQRRLERADELLQRARDELAGFRHENMESLFVNARNGLERGWEFFRNRNYRPAIKLAEQVEQAARQLLDLAQTGRRMEAEYQQRLGSVDRLIEYAREATADCDSELGREHLNRAQESLLRARNLYGEGHIEPALQALRQARDAARMAARECQGTQKLEARLEQLRAEADRTAEQLRQAGVQDPEAARRLLNQAYEQLDMANKFLSEDKIESAQMALQAAQLALRQARRYITSGF
jgi:hypothetical protein